MKLDQYLKRHGVKPSAFAARIGVAASTIGRILKGERNPRMTLVLKISRATNGEVRFEDWTDSSAVGDSQIQGDVE